MNLIGNFFENNGRVQNEYVQVLLLAKQYLNFFTGRARLGNLYISLAELSREPTLTARSNRSSQNCRIDSSSKALQDKAVFEIVRSTVVISNSSVLQDAVGLGGVVDSAMPCDT